MSFGEGNLVPFFLEEENKSLLLKGEINLILFLIPKLSLCYSFKLRMKNHLKYLCFENFPMYKNV
jgi:hypothetical protein